MQKRDYVRQSKKSNNNRVFIFAIIIILLLSAVSFLWFLKEKAPVPVQKTVITKPEPKEQSILPSRPEERYSYIRDLETREIAVDDEQAFNKLAQLNEKQKALLKERELAEQRRLAEIEQANNTASATPQIKPIETPIIRIQKESKVDKEQEKQQRLEQQRAEDERLAIEQKKLEQQRQAQREQAKQNSPKPTARFGVQCGAFRNSDQAENMYARLSMAGFNAQVIKGNKWNRVIIAPINTKSEAKKIMQKVKPIADCIVVGF
ncbi:Cell division protein FtsN [Phocoenobacter uteri]|uniref:Cell division protein FtsN n=1 Tax=Phocoenobacter uteri TaxID=146806 RepID=A0A379CA15_9PAST|nr:cell division protein FtsN [Phocoenobacter uteri]MDG6881111.1 hypothetical protein [Phocoenobacter uteri]SUB59133.1 Cell division protein FtsN [Phocoenobacter uteri]